MKIGFQKIIENAFNFKKKLSSAQKEILWSKEKERFIEIIKNVNNN